jgi:hypothetical protein
MTTATLAPLPTGADLRSVQETETRLLGALGRATEPVSLPELCRRAHLSIDLSRSVFSGLVKAGKVLIKQDKPPLYALPGQAKPSPRTPARSISVSRVHYQGTELQATPGIGPERFAAFALPSRVGDWLHYPDGRVERMPSLRGEA